MDLDYFLLLVLKPGLEVCAACTIPSSRALDFDSEMRGRPLQWIPSLWGHYREGFVWSFSFLSLAKTRSNYVTQADFPFILLPQPLGLQACVKVPGYSLLDSLFFLVQDPIFPFWFLPAITKSSNNTSLFRWTLFLPQKQCCFAASTLGTWPFLWLLVKYT